MSPPSEPGPGDTDWTEVRKGWAYQRRRHMLLSTQWSPRWLVLYCKPVLALAVYEQKGDARPPFTPLLHLDLSGIQVEERTTGRSGGLFSQPHSRSSSCADVAHPEKRSAKWTDKLISRIDSVAGTLRSATQTPAQTPTPAGHPTKQALEDHMIAIQKDSGEKWTFGFASRQEKDDWLRAIRELQAEAELAKRLDQVELDGGGSPGGRRKSSLGQHSAEALGLQVYGVTVLGEQCVQCLQSSTPPQFSELTAEDGLHFSKICLNDPSKPGNGGFDDFNQLYQTLLSERRSKQGRETKDADRVNDLALLRVVGLFNQLVSQKVQSHIDQYHHQPGGLDGLLLELHHGLVQVELVVQYEDGPNERDVAFANSVVRHELHSLQMVNEQRRCPVFTTLMSVLEYKGFRVLAYWSLPLSNDTLMLREVEGDAVIVTEPAVALCRSLAQAFGFMVDYPNKITGRPTCLHTGVEVHSVDPGLVKLSGEQAARARLLPSGFYLTAMSDMLPQYVLDQQDPVPKRLRPELVRAYVAAHHTTLPNADNYPEKTAGVVKYLMGPVIDGIVQRLENLDVLPVDSIEWTDLLHSHGVNVALLGEVHKRATLPHVREHCLVEMVARAFKCVLADQLRLAIRHFKQVQALKVEEELRSVVLAWIDELVVQQRGRWIDELLVPLVRVKYRVQLDGDALRHLPKQVLLYAMQHHAGLVIADKEYDFQRFLAEDLLGFRVREVSSSMAAGRVAVEEREDALYNVGILTLPLTLNSLWRDLSLRAELARRLEQYGIAASEAKAMTMAENVAPTSHVVGGLVKLHQLARLFKQPVCSASAARSALGEIARASRLAQTVAARHLGAHHPIGIVIRQQEFDLLQRLLDRLKLPTTGKTNPVREILAQTLECRQAAFAMSSRVLGKSHQVTRSLIVSIGELQERTGDLEKAIASFQEALKSTNKNDGSGERARLLLSVARCYQQKGELETALECGQEARRCLEGHVLSGDGGDSKVHGAVDSCYKLIADLALAITTNGDTVAGAGEWEDQQQQQEVMSANMVGLVSTAAECYELLYERVRSRPEQLEGEEVVRLLRRIIGLRLQLAKPAQRTIVKAARRLPAQANDGARARDLILRMVTTASVAGFVERALDGAAQNPTAAGMDELRLLAVIASGGQQ